MNEGKTIGMLEVRDIANAKKKGVSLDALYSEYHCEKKAFEARLRVLYGHKWKSALKDLIKSAEKRHGRSKETKERLKKGEEMIREAEEQNENVEDAVEEELSELDLLKQKKAAIAAELQEFQYYIESLESEKNLRLEYLSDDNDNLAQIYEEISRLLALIEVKKLDIQAIMKDKLELKQVVGEINSQISTVNAVCEQKRIELAATQEEIAELEKILIYVYSDGSVIGESKYGIVELDDRGYEKLRSSLVYRPECDDIAVKDTWVLARALQIVKNLGKRRYMIIFSKAEIEAAFNAIISEQ